MLAMDLSKITVLGALAIVTGAGVAALIGKGLHIWRAHRVAADLYRFFCQAQAVHEKMQTGLKTMAGIVPQLEDPRRELSRRGVALLDQHAVSMMAMERALGAPHGRTRLRRVASRHLQNLNGLHGAFEAFQQAVLAALYEQAATRVVMPPLVVRRYRAAFRVLEHALPDELWQVMNEILVRNIELWTLDMMGEWHKVRDVGARLGKDVMFSRSCFENAVELHLIVHDLNGRAFTSEFVVTHSHTLTARRWPQWRKSPLKRDEFSR